MENEKKYRLIFENSPFGIGYFDKNGIITDLNDNAAKLLNIPKEKLLGLNISKSINDKSMNQTIKETLHGKKSYFEGNYTSIFNGKTIIIKAYFGPVISENGTILGGMVIVEDISSQIKAKRDLYESEEKFKNLAEQSPNMIFINKMGKIVYTNQACEHIMGYKIEEFLAPDFNFLSLICPESIEMIKKAFDKHKKGEDVPSYEYRLVTKQGRIIDAIITS
ncbi:PAS domain S-box protein [Candidatus Desantisbacteria bacterium]|nr:PAS domain S-box protein [Candidatus Desantisbacteria bacterium]